MTCAAKDDLPLGCAQVSEVVHHTPVKKVQLIVLKLISHQNFTFNIDFVEREGLGPRNHQKRKFTLSKEVVVLIKIISGY